MKKTKLNLIFGLTATVATLTTITPAQAFTWTTSGNFGATPFSGSFTIDDESLGAGATVTASNINIGTVTYNNLADTITVTGAGNVTGVTWLITTPDPTNCTTPACLLTLNFNAPFLTNAGGTVSLAGSSTINQAQDGLGGVGITGSVSAPSIIPFNFSTTPGLVVLGLITGVAKGRKHLPKIKEKLKELLTKK